MFYKLVFFLIIIIIRGEWNSEEDQSILRFVFHNGTKWAKLAKRFFNRTEHAVKNRFFSLISSYINLPIKMIKKEINFLNKTLIINFHQKETFFTFEEEEQKINEKQHEFIISNNFENHCSYDGFLEKMSDY